jgi:hypothetical protein
MELNLDETDFDIIKLKNKLDDITKKYIKYKKKYMNIKNNHTEYLLNNQITNTS